MRVIICGAGQVGHSIAAIMRREGADVTLIDLDAAHIARLDGGLGINGIVGHGSSPDVLARAGAQDADMVIAVTPSDEVNMVACQVAHSLFNVPKKIARIREQSYLDPAWLSLFSRTHMPIDLIISPELEVARSISQRLQVPGATNLITLADGKIRMAAVVCTASSAVNGLSLAQLAEPLARAMTRIALIIRDGRAFLPAAIEILRTGDELYFFVESTRLPAAMALFGHDPEKSRQVVIAGGGHVGLCLADMLRADRKESGLKIIEQNAARARFLAERLPGVTILNGDALDPVLLAEANAGSLETLVAVTDSDTVNITASLLARQQGCGRVITLVNRPGYSELMTGLGIGAIISPQASTVSRIMQSVRRGRIKALHSLRDGLVEVMEAEASDTTPLAGRPLSDLGLPAGVVLGALVRNGVIVTPGPDAVVKSGDHIVTLALQDQARAIEKLFTVQVDLF